MVFSNITTNPKILNNQPIIKGTRISVALILEWLANGSSIQEICYEFPQLSKESVKEALLYAAARSKDELFYEVQVA
jgi:uncharacterized protein (DUF433 family)